MQNQVLRPSIMDGNNGPIQQSSDLKIKEEVTDSKTKSILQETLSMLNIEATDGAILDSSSLLNNDGDGTSTSSSPQKQRHLYESPEARARRLARNAERMRERRANESEDEYRIRLIKMAEANRMRRRNENEIERTMRHLKDAARQRLRRAMESPEQRASRLAKLAERSRYFREHETPEQKTDRRRKCLEHNRARYQRQQQSQHDQNQQPNVMTLGASITKLTNSNLIPGVQMKSENSTMTPSPSGSSNLSPNSGASSQSYENLYPTPSYPILKPNQFPDLPPHLAPNQAKYYGSIQNFMPATPPSLQYISSQTSTLPPPPSSSIISSAGHGNPHTTSTSFTPTRPPVFPGQLHTSHQIQQPQPALPYPPLLTQQSANSLSVAQPEISRGRPVKIFPSNDYTCIAPALQDEAIRQQKLSYMLEEQINIMLTSPRSARGRPNKGNETDPERMERLRKMAEMRRAQRDKETPDERQARLKDLAERAKKRRESIIKDESPEERKERLSRQAEYARQRRLKCQTPQAIRQAEQRAKDLYFKTHP